MHLHYLEHFGASVYDVAISRKIILLSFYFTVVRLLKDKAVIRINEKIHRVPHGVDDSNRCNGKLFSVVPVNRKDSESWIKSQKKRILSNTAEKPSL